MTDYQANLAKNDLTKYNQVQQNNYLSMLANSYFMKDALDGNLK